jgi:hypothetical protein
MFLFSLSMMLVMAFASPIAAEQSAACSLLTSSEIEAATGGHVSAAEPMQLDDIATDPERVMKVIGCMWGVASPTGQLTMTWFQGPLTDEEIAQLIKANKRNTDIDDMRTANYREEAKEFPNAWCSIFIPSASEKPHLLLSTCAGGVNRQGLSITFSSQTTSLTIDQVKALLDKAGERAH